MNAREDWCPECNWEPHSEHQRQVPQTALVPADVDQGNNPLQGREIGGKVYLAPRKMPGHVVCIACGMNVAVRNIDLHHTAHMAHRDHTLPQAIAKLLETGDY